MRSEKKPSIGPPEIQLERQPSVQRSIQSFWGKDPAIANADASSQRGADANFTSDTLIDKQLLGSSVATNNLCELGGISSNQSIRTSQDDSLQHPNGALTTDSDLLQERDTNVSASALHNVSTSTLQLNPKNAWWIKPTENHLKPTSENDNQPLPALAEENLDISQESSDDTDGDVMSVDKKQPKFFLISLKISPEKLKKFQKPIHPFFAKRYRPEPQKPSSLNSFFKQSQNDLISRPNSASGISFRSSGMEKSIPMERSISESGMYKTQSTEEMRGKVAPFRIYHSRGDVPPPKTCSKSFAESTLLRKKRLASVDKVSNSHEDLGTLLQNWRKATFKKSNVLKLPNFVNLTFDQLNSLISNTVIRDAVTSHLISAALAPQFERTNDPWCVKFSPSTANTTFSPCGVKILEHIKSAVKFFREIEDFPEKKKKKRKGEFDNFIVYEPLIEDNDDKTWPKMLVLCGPHGSGKSSTVFAVAQELDAHILEVNSTSSRSGKDVLDLIGAAGTAQLVHHQQNYKRTGIVLFEEVDILYSSDSSFWTGVEKFLFTSKRPIVLTCTTLNHIPKHLLDDFCEVLTFEKPSTRTLVDIVWLIALSEGYVADRKDVIALVKENNNDARKCINSAQYLCMSSGEASNLYQNGSKCFVVADLGMLKQLDSPEIAKQTLQLDASTLDIWSSSSRSLFEIDTPPDDLLLNEISYQHSKQLPFPFELSFTGIEPTLDKFVGEASAVREALENLALGKYGQLEYSQVITSRDAVLCCEIAPYVREMARWDRARMIVAERLTGLEGGMVRKTRSAFSALGVDNRRHLSNIDLAAILRTGYVD